MDRDPFRAAAMEMFRGSVGRVLADAGYDEAQRLAVLEQLEGDLGAIMGQDWPEPDYGTAPDPRRLKSA